MRENGGREVIERGKGEEDEQERRGGRWVKWEREKGRNHRG